MTNNNVVALVIADALVRKQHTTFRDGRPVAPTAAYLEALAQAELQNEINSLCRKKSIARHLLEGDYTLTLSNGTEITQGLRFTLPERVKSVMNITVGTGKRPIDSFDNRQAFDDWWYRRVGEASSGTDAGALRWIPWGHSPTGNKLRILISPGGGGDSEANVHYIRKLTQPVQISALPDDVHDIVVLGVKKRLSGRVLQGSYDEAVRELEHQLDPVVGAASPMPLSDEQVQFNAEMSIEAGGPSGSRLRRWDK